MFTSHTRHVCTIHEKKHTRARGERVTNTHTGKDSKQKFFD